MDKYAHMHETERILYIVEAIEASSRGIGRLVVGNRVALDGEKVRHPCYERMKK